MELLAPYKNIIFIFGIVGIISLFQLIIADLCALKLKHTPGYPIKPDHNSLLFRTARTHSNTNESIAVFVIFSLFGIFSAADAEWLFNFALVFLVGRLLHMVFYYANVQLARSAAFVLVLIGLLGMFIVSILAW